MITSRMPRDTKVAAAQYRMKAEQLRVMAHDLVAADMRELLQSLADAYDRLADHYDAEGNEPIQ